MQATVFTDNFDASPLGRWANQIKDFVWDSVSLEFDLPNDNDVAVRYTNSPGSVEHEAQITAQAPVGNRLVGVGVRFNSTGPSDAYGMAFESNSTISLYRYRNGARTGIANINLNPPVPFVGGNYYSMRMAASGAPGSPVVLRVWMVNHGAAKPADPGWVGNDDAPNGTFTDNAASGTRLDGAQHSQAGLAGRAGTSSFDEHYDFFKVRAISDRGPAEPPEPDTVAPAVSVTAPSSGVTVSGTTVAVSATASDNVGVIGVQFLLDGANLGAEDTTSPHAIAWSTTTAANGAHVLTATARDAAGNTTVSAPVPVMVDNLAPTISVVSSSNAGETSVTITWTTDEASTSRVEYGTTPSYGQSTTLNMAMVTEHSVTLSGLSPSTTYNYRVRSADPAGNERVSGNNTFATVNVPDTSAPTVPTGLTATVVSPTQINVSWNASTDNVGVSGYELLRNGVGASSQTELTFQDTGLTRGIAYIYSVRARDAAGNTSAFSAAVSAETPAFVIVNVTASSIQATRATINWTTDVATNAQVEYGPTTAYGFMTAVDPAMINNHVVALTQLNASTTYNYRVRSIDEHGNQVVSANFTFVTSTGSTSGGFQNEILFSGLSFPVHVKFLPDGHILIPELGGRIVLLEPGGTEMAPQPFMQVNTGTVNGYQGLFDLVLDPDFENNRFFYVFYTNVEPNRDRVSRFTATADYHSVVPGSELILYQDTHRAGEDHHGGALNFASDGKLYITTGENFQPERAQDLTLTQGKILRINTDGTIPADNPFHDGSGPNADAIWALGLRNPFRAWIDPTNDKFYIADVGGNNHATSIEEVNLGVRGANYGWPVCESTCTTPPYTQPLYYYPHNGRDSSITGGMVYHGAQFPAEYRGSYFFADYAQNWIKRLTFDVVGNISGVHNFEPANGSTDGPTGDIVALAEGPDGALYYVDLGYNEDDNTTGVGKLRRIRYIANNAPPIAAASASAQTSQTAPFTVDFSSAGSADSDGDLLTYAWDFGDGTTSTEANPSHTYTGTGQFTVTLTVSDGSVNTTAAPISITIGNRPSISFLSPTDGAFFRAGNIITFNAAATDVENGTLPASAFTWNIDFMHDGHVHPGLPNVGNRSGTFVIPTSGHDFHGNVRYRFTVTVTDADGLSASHSVFIWPERVNLTFESVPTGAILALDGLPMTTPFTYDTLIGFNHVITAPNFTRGSNAYTFESWSDQGAQQHSITVPAADRTYSVTYTATQSFVFTDGFDSNPLTSGRFTQLAGNAPVHDAANGELDVAANGNRWGFRFNSTFNSANHEAQVTWQLGTLPGNDGVGGPAVRVRGDSTTEWYYVEYHRSSSLIIIKRKNSDGRSTVVGTAQTLALPVSSFITVRLAAEGSTLSLWWQIHGTTKPADPGWIGEGDTPNYAVTDTTYNGAAHSYAGIAGHWGGADYDTRHDYFKARAR